MNAGTALILNALKARFGEARYQMLARKDMPVPPHTVWTWVSRKRVSSRSKEALLRLFPELKEDDFREVHEGPRRSQLVPTAGCKGVLQNIINIKAATEPTASIIIPEVSWKETKIRVKKLPLNDAPKNMVQLSVLGDILFLLKDPDTTKRIVRVTDHLAPMGLSLADVLRAAGEA